MTASTNMGKRICLVEGCEGRRFARGYCNKHRLRLDRHGTTDPPNREIDPLERFAPKVDTEADGGCWIWTASTRGTTGYGQFYFKGTMVGAHRAGYELLVGEISDDLEVDHLCRQRLCVNPDHLELVTRSENNRRALRIRWNR